MFENKLSNRIYELNFQIECIQAPDISINILNLNYALIN